MLKLGWLGAIAALAFYGLWPAYAAYSMRSALEAGDPVALESRIDFPSVREGLRPVVAEKADATLKDLLKAAGPGSGPLLDRLRAQIMPGLVDRVLNSAVTPQNVVRMYAEGRDFKDLIEGVVKDEAAKAGTGTGGAGTSPGAEAGSTLGKLKDLADKYGIDTGKVLGGLFGDKSATTTAPAGEQAVSGGQGTKRKYGLANIKDIGLDGALGIRLGVARDPAAKDADLTLGMSFVDGGWKITRLVPKL